MKKEWMKYFFIGGILIIVGVILFFVLGKKEEPEIKDNEPKKEIVEPKKELKILNLNSNSRPISVMINNHKTAQPNQTGLNDAYLVYEIIVEGGISRMMAVFKDSNLDKIGTIRSARPYFLDYVMENDSLYTHFGGSAEAESDISSLNINNISGMRDDGFWRDKSLLNKGVPLEHTAYNNIEKILKVAKNRGYRLTTESKPLLNYSIDELKMEEIEEYKVANNVSIKYSDYQTNNFKYDSEKKAYIRYSDDVLRKDYVTGKPFYAKNIITYQVSNHTTDAAGHQQLDNIGSGNGYFISNGYAVPITWQKDSRSSKTIYKYKNGKELVVNDGVTYIQIQPKGQKLTIS